jgi:hypothetical protein
MSHWCSLYLIFLSSFKYKVFIFLSDLCLTFLLCIRLWICFSFLFHYSSLLYKNMIKFCVLIMFTIALPHWLISYRFLQTSLSVLHTQVKMSSLNNHYSTSSSPIGSLRFLFLASFLWLELHAVLNRSGEGRHACLKRGKNENVTYKNLWATPKAVWRGMQNCSLVSVIYHITGWRKNSRDYINWCRKSSWCNSTPLF